MRHINIKHRVTGSHIIIFNLPTFSVSISAHCIYNLQGYAYSYTFVTFGLLQIRSFKFDSWYICKSLLNINVGISTWIHCITVG